MGDLAKLIRDAPALSRIDRYMTYRNWYRRWNQLQRFALITSLLEQNLPSGGLLLDAGCGPGLYAVELSRQFTVSAVDIRENYLDQLSAWCKEVHREVAVSRQDITQLSFAAGTFDVVLCTEVLEHLECPKAGLLELHRVLKQDGRLCVSMPNRGSLYWVGRRLVGRRDRETWKHTRYAERDIRRLLCECGFSVLQGCGVNHLEVPIASLVNLLCRSRCMMIAGNRLEHVLNRTPLWRLGGNLIFLCAKRSDPAAACESITEAGRLPDPLASHRSEAPGVGAPLRTLGPGNE